jgi:hypothetical protein
MSSRARWLLVLTMVGCADLERGHPLTVDAAAETGGPATEGGAGDSAVATASFARDVHPLLVDLCGRCHSASGQASNTALVLGNDPGRDLAPVRRLVNGDNPTGSRLLAKGAGSGHGGGAIVAPGTTEYRIILDWITQGSAP